YSLTRVALQVVSAIVIGIAFLRLSSSATDLQNKVFALFQTAIISILIINQVQPAFLRQRLYYGREASSNQYGWRAFSVAIIVTEWPFSVFANTMYFVIMYWLVGLNSGSDRIGYFYIMYIVLGIFSITLGQAIASFSPNDIIAAMLNPIFTSMVILFCGVTIPYPLMPKFWKFMYRLSPFTYFLEGTLTNDLHGAKVRCRNEELYVFQPPKGMSCSKYADGFVQNYIGYLNNPNATSNCQYCPYKVGDDYYSALSWNFDHRWRNFGLLFAYLAFNIAFTTFMIKIYKVNKR
ncbi:ATP-binding cassette transporter snq2, partial [Linderina pennispora]